MHSPISFFRRFIIHLRMEYVRPRQRTRQRGPRQIWSCSWTARTRFNAAQVRSAVLIQTYARCWW